MLRDQRPELLLEEFHPDSAVWQRVGLERSTAPGV